MLTKAASVAQPMVLQLQSMKDYMNLVLYDSKVNQYNIA